MKRKRSANPSIRPVPKLRTLHLLQRRVRGSGNGLRSTGEVSAAGGGVPGVGPEGQEVGRGQRRGTAVVAEVVRGFAGGAQPHQAYVFAKRRADRLKAEPGHQASRGRLVPGEGLALRANAACKDGAVHAAPASWGATLGRVNCRQPRRAP